jgi:hypothetical protein
MNVSSFYYDKYLKFIKSVYFYGASITGQCMLKIFKRFGIPVKAFIDSDSKKWGSEFCGYKIVSVNDVPNDCYIIITTGYSYIREIENNLRTRYFFNDVYSFPENLLAKTNFFNVEYEIEDIDVYERIYQEIKSDYDKIEPYYLWADRIGEMLYRFKVWEKEKLNRNDNIYRILLPVFLSRGKKIANRRLMEIMTRKMNIVYLYNEKLWSYIFSEHIQEIDMSVIDTYSVNWNNNIDTVYSSSLMYKKRGESDICFNKNEKQEAINKCKELNINIEKEIVCIFARDREYLGKRYGDINFRNYEDFHNAEIKTYNLLIDYLEQLDYQVIRVGAIAEKKLEDKRVVDITNENYDELLDLYINSKCRCWVGSESGACFIPQLFGKRAVYVNFTQIFNVYSIITYCIDKASLYIPKLYYSKKDNRYLSLAEMCKLNLLETEPDKYEEQYGVCMVENTPEDICEAYKESELKECGKWNYTEDRENLQKRYKEILYGICHKYPKAPERLMGFDTRNCIHPLEIGTSFLEKYSFLLD